MHLKMTLQIIEHLNLPMIAIFFITKYQFLCIAAAWASLVSYILPSMHNYLTRNRIFYMQPTSNYIRSRWCNERLNTSSWEKFGGMS